MRAQFFGSVLMFAVGCGEAETEPPVDGGREDAGDPDSGLGDGGSTDPDSGLGDGGSTDAASDGGAGLVTAQVDSTVAYGSGREVGVRVHYPVGTTGPHWIVLISHGGLGMGAGETRFDHLGLPLAERGGVAVQLGHRRSASNDEHLLDRPRDVSAVIDALAAGTIALDGFAGSLVTSAVGHTGHSGGAYTSHAVAGARYRYAPEADPRVVAIAPISPQGIGDFFGAYDDGPTDNTWVTVEVPLLTLVGGEELDSNGVGRFVADDWRLQPWSRYPDTADRIRIIVPGQDHSDMGGQGPPEVQAYLGTAIARFFAFVLSGEGDLCSVGTDSVLGGVTPIIETAPASGGSLASCP